MKLPMLVQRSSGIALAGLANLKKLKRFLEPEGLRAVSLTPTKGLVLLFGMNYESSSLGPYQELVIQVASTTRGHQSRSFLSRTQDLASIASVIVPLLNRATDGFHRATPLFMWKLFVTTPLALHAGRDVWGFPKDLASVDVKIAPGRFFGRSCRSFRRRFLPPNNVTAKFKFRMNELSIQAECPAGYASSNIESNY